MTITHTFDPPQPTDSPAVFNSKAFALAAGLNDWSAQANATAVEVNATQAAATAASQTAQASATAAVGAANYRGDYNPATTYAVGQSVSHGGLVWVAKTSNTGITPVAGVNWQMLKASAPPFEDPAVLAQVQAIALCF
jgi:hypothetical protein